MSLEIERKYLVRTDRLPPLRRGTRIRQSYFSVRSGVGRVRISGRTAYLTLKGPTRGLVRTELECEIPLPVARALMADLCSPEMVAKSRYRVRHAGRTWEIDRFHGQNRGLVLAEVELPRADAEVLAPSWIGPEVSLDRRFANSALASKPFLAWPKAQRDAIRAAMRGVPDVKPDRRRRRATA